VNSCNFVSVRLKNRGEKRQISRERLKKGHKKFSWAVVLVTGHGQNFRIMTKKTVIRNFGRWKFFSHKGEISDILVLKTILVLVFIQFWGNNFYFSFSFSFEIILVSISVLVLVLK